MATHYYSGQGRLYVGDRNASGGADFLTAVGNCPSLELSVETTKFEHKESRTGARAVDVSIIQEKKGTISMTLESLDIDNLSLALWGEKTSTAAGGGGTAQIQLAATLRTGAGEAEKRIPIGDGLQKLTLTDIENQVPTVLEFGTGANDPGSKNGYIDADNGMLVVWASGYEPNGTPATAVGDTELLDVNYSAVGAFSKMDAFTETSMTRYLRFEGLNTIDNGAGGDKEVIVDVYKVELDPLTGYALINEEVGSIEVTGTILADDLRTAPYQYFQQVNVD